MTIQELYHDSIKPLPAAERLQLASIILGDIPPQSLVDFRSEWSDEDLKDLNRASWQLIESEVEYPDDV
jgi:hypothetical protein